MCRFSAPLQRFEGRWVSVLCLSSDIYSSVIGQSAIIDPLLTSLKAKLKEEVRLQKDMFQLLGALDLLMAASHAHGRRAASSGTAGPITNTSTAMVPVLARSRSPALNPTRNHDDAQDVDQDDEDLAEEEEEEVEEEEEQEEAEEEGEDQEEVTLQGARRVAGFEADVAPAPMSAVVGKRKTNSSVSSDLLRDRRLESDKPKRSK